MFQSKQVSQQVEKNTQYLSIYHHLLQIINTLNKFINIEIKSMFEQAYQKSTNHSSIELHTLFGCQDQEYINAYITQFIHNQLSKQISKQVSKQINKQAKKEQSCINSSQIYL
ncbi:hypothetical protein ABPG72_018080 [Tetrahymena utriculariae]